MKAKELQDLIDFIAKSGLNKVNIETDEFKISVQRDASYKPQVTMSAAPAAAARCSGTHCSDASCTSRPGCSQPRSRPPPPKRRPPARRASEVANDWYVLPQQQPRNAGCSCR